MSVLCAAVTLTCSVDFKICGFVGNVAHVFNAWTHDCDLGGISVVFHLHRKWTSGNFLIPKQHDHLENKDSIYPETAVGTKSLMTPQSTIETLNLDIDHQLYRHQHA